MYIQTVFSGVVALFAVSATAAPTALTTRQSTDSYIGLYLNSTQFDISELATFKVSYANSSAWIGPIKYESYSEPLVIFSFNGDDNVVSFLSIHSSPTGFQQMYIKPDQSQPVAFSVPHGSAPQGVSTSGFSFGPAGALLHNGLNQFYACKNDTLASLNYYQIFWLAAGQPAGFTCQGPVSIGAGDACNRY